MSDASQVARNLRERLGGGSEERLGRALSELLENPLLTGAIGRAFDAREKATQAQELAMGALNLPSAADIERLTRRLRSVSLRLEGIEDAVDRLDRALSTAGAASSPEGDRADTSARLAAIDAELKGLSERLDRVLAAQGAATAAAPSQSESQAAAGAGAKPKRPAKRAKAAGGLTR